MMEDFQEQVDFIIENTCKDEEDKITFFHPLNYALLGYVQLSDGTFRTAYNKQSIIAKKAIEIESDENYEHDEEYDSQIMALEYYYHNILGTGLSEGTPVFLEGYWDQEFSDILFDQDEEEIFNWLIDEGNWEIFECDAETFEFDYLLILDGDKMKAKGISTDGFPDSFAFLYRSKKG